MRNPKSRKPSSPPRGRHRPERAQQQDKVREKPRHGGTSWDHVSQWYGRVIEKEGGSYQTDLILPAVLPLIRPDKSMRLLDIGCGPGFFSAEIADKGAYVIGVDLSPRFVQEARRRVPRNRGEFHTASAESLPLQADAANAALAVLSLQNIEGLEDAIAETSRVLEPKSPFHIVLNHPAFRVPRGSGWGYDAARKIQFRRIDRYLSPFSLPIQMHPGKNPDLVTLSFHRPLQTYVQALAGAGFYIADLREWTSHKESVGRHAKAENRAREEIPLFLYLRAVKKELS